MGVVGGRACADCSAAQTSMITKDATRQSECLRYIDTYFKAWGNSPTRSEIGARMGITKVSAHLLINKLKNDGLVVTVGNSWRNLRITSTGKDVASGLLAGFHNQAALRLRRG